jgi:hypothetical protein
MENVSDIRDRMQEIANLPPGYGFFVLCFPFNAPPDTRGEYVSNARRKDVARVMQNFVQNNPIQDPEKN